MAMFKLQPETFSEAGLEVFECVISKDGTELPGKPAKPKKPLHRKPIAAKRRRPKSKGQ